MGNRYRHKKSVSMGKNSNVVNKKTEHVFHKMERKLIKGYLDLYNKQIISELENTYVGPYDSGINIKLIELKAKKEFCEKLLG